MNIWHSYNEERGCLMHFAHLANTLLKDEESARDNYVLVYNLYIHRYIHRFAKYSPILNFFSLLAVDIPDGWLGSRVVSLLDSGAEGPGFKSQSRRCRVTVLGKLFTPTVQLFTKQQNW